MSEEGGHTVITANGYNGQVTFDGNFVTITRKGGLARLTVGKGEKRIPITSVTAVQWKPPGAVVNGFIQFTLAGGVERRSSLGSQTFDAVNDENSVIVTKKQVAEFQPLRDAVEEAIVQRHQPQQVVAAAPQASKLDQLKQLGELRDSGVLSQEEFEAEKARIMASDQPQPATPPAPVPPSSAPAPARVRAFDDTVGASMDWDSQGGRSDGKATAKRVGAAWATGGLSEAARLAKKRKAAKAGPSPRGTVL